MSLMEACQASPTFPLVGNSQSWDSWDMMQFKRFLVANLGALRRFFNAITTACSTGPTFGVCVFVTCKASGFLYHCEAGFARATSSLPRGLGSLFILAPAMEMDWGIAFRWLPVLYIDGREYVRTKASLWSIDGPGIVK